MVFVFLSLTEALMWLILHFSRVGECRNHSEHLKCTENGQVSRRTIRKHMRGSQHRVSRGTIVGHSRLNF